MNTLDRSINSDGNCRIGRARRFAIAVVVLDIALATLTAFDVLGLARIWINLFWLVSAGGAFGISLCDFERRTTPRSTVRRALSVALGVYFAGQIVWAILVATGRDAVPGPADAFFLFTPLAVIWGAWLDMKRRASVISFLTSQLDALTVFLAIAVGTLAVFGSEAGGIEGIVLLLYPILYLAPAGAFLVITFAKADRPCLKGICLVLAGAFVLGGSFTYWTAEALLQTPPAGNVADYLFGVGLLLTGYGAATWDVNDNSPLGEVAILRTASEILPLVTVVLATFIAIRAESTPLMMMLIWIALLGMLVINGIRQITLIRAQRENEDSLRTLSAELSNAEDRERRRIATFLHDRVGQAIALLSIKFGLARGESDGARKVVLEQEIDDLLKETADNTRSTTFELSPPDLYELGLAPAVARLAKTLGEDNRKKMTVIDGSPDMPIRDDVAPLLYRFVRELLMNTIKHAEAAETKVEIDRLGDEAIIVVEDNGVGFDAAVTETRRAPGFGLVSIRERMRTLGGRLEIRSERGQGTSVRIVVPLPR